MQIERTDFAQFGQHRNQRDFDDAFPERPIYFARTSASYGESLGLGPYLLTQGLARKLMPSMLTASRDTVNIPGQGFLDVSRTKTLWTNVFVGQKAIVKKGRWVDRPSVGIPYLYVSTGLILAEGLSTNPAERAAVSQVLDTTRQLAKITRLGDIGPVADQMPPVPLMRDTAAVTKVPVKKPAK